MTYPPESPPPFDVVYEDPRPYGSAPTLVKLAGIFNLIIGGLDILWGLLLASMGALVATGIIPKSMLEDSGGLPEAFRGTGVPAVGILGSVYIVLGVLSLADSVVKLIAGVKFVRVRQGAWGWGLVAGIIGCVQLWCSFLCVVPMAAGIFTLVVIGSENVRNYLRDTQK